MKLLAVDGNSLLNRAFYGVRTLCNSEGFPTNALYGFYSMILKLLKREDPTHVMVAFDMRTKTFRHKKFELYKANRKKMPNELYLQLVEAKRMLKLLGIKVIEREGFEADDLLGTICRICSENQLECVVASGDRDVLQLVNKYVKVLLIGNRSNCLFDEAAVVNKFGVCSKQLIEVKALMGDASDNIPGVRGIGEKIALKLISNFHDVDNIFKNLDSLDVSSRIKKLLNSQEAKNMCFLSKELGTICVFAGLDENLDLYLKKEVDIYGLKTFLEKFELRKFLKSLNELNGPKSEGLKLGFTNVVSEKKFKVFVDLELDVVREKLQLTESLNFFFCDDFLIIVCDDEIFKFKDLKLQAFKTLIVNCDKLKKTTDLKNVYRFAISNGLELENVVFSCDIAAYLINVLDKNYDLLSLTKKFFNCCELDRYFLPVCDKLQCQIQEKNLSFLFNNVELPLSRVLAEMELCGFGVDKTSLVDFGKFLIKQIEVLKNEIWRFCGKQFNINSTKELGNILFNDLNLPKTRKTKTGYSTDAESLLKLVKYSDIVLSILNYRESMKLYSTYVVGLQKVICSDGRIHSKFNQTQTRTGRISSLEPNIQNIPIKTELGSKMRKFFVAKNGFILVDGDYSQIELRILADMADDEKMIEAFKTGQDIHKTTASQIFGIAVDDVSEEFRRRAKVINFSIIYGIGAFSLAKDLGVSIDCARGYIDSFFECYGKIKTYFENVIDNAKRTGEVKTMFGRVRRIPELSSRLKKMVSLGERIAKNTPIQGTCADLIKMAMINVSSVLKRKRLKADLILQVHDELLIETEESCVDEVAKLLKWEMENVVELKVPLVADITFGKTWFDCY